jgi:single-strand DNA-binding protein
MRGTCMVFLTGHAGADGVVRYTPAGTAVLRISIATDSNGHNGAAAGEWHRVVVVGSQAEDRENAVKKGGLCLVQGTLRTRDYSAKGVSRRVTEVLVDREGVFKVYHNSPLKEPTRETDQQRPATRTSTMRVPHASLSSQQAMAPHPKTVKPASPTMNDEWLSFEGLSLNVYPEPFD